jgi:hypothetical protein
VATSIHYRKYDLVTFCGLKSSLYRPLRLTLNKQDVTCLKCLEKMEDKNVEDTSTDT